MLSMGHYQRGVLISGGVTCTWVYVQASMELGPEDLIREVSSLQRVLCTGFGGEDVSLLERCPHFGGCYVQDSVELGPEDMSLLERCPHFGGCYVQALVELGPEDMSLFGRCHMYSGIRT